MGFLGEQPWSSRGGQADFYIKNLSMMILYYARGVASVTLLVVSAAISSRFSSSTTESFKAPGCERPLTEEDFMYSIARFITREGLRDSALRLLSTFPAIGSIRLSPEFWT